MQAEKYFEIEEPPDSSRSVDELIARFIELDALYKETVATRREIGLELAGRAFEKRTDAQNTVHLSSSNGKRVKVEFGKDYEYNAEQMFTAREVLGNEQFDQLFDTRIEFKAKKRSLNMFMNTVHASEQLETGKQIITDPTV